MRAAFHRQGRYFIFVVSTFELTAGRTTIVGYNDPNVLNPGVILKALKRDCGG